MRKRFSCVVWLMIAFVILSLSCGKDGGKSPTGPGDDTPADMGISESAVVVEQRDDITVSTVAENEIVFTFTGKEPEVETGDVLVSGEGDGYLRKVKTVTVDGNTVTVETEQATLTDVIEEGKIDTTITLDFGVEQLEKGIGVMKAAKGVTTKAGGIDLSGVELFSGTVGNTSGSLTITAGSIDFKPDVTLVNEIDESTNKYFKASLTGTLDFDFDIEASVAGELALQDSLSLITYRHVAVQMIGWLPVVEVFKYDLVAGYYIDAEAQGTFTTGFKHTRKIEVGGEYTNSTWSEIWEVTPEQPVFTPRTSKFKAEAGVTVHVYVKPVVSVRLYDVAGPYIDLRPYLEFDGEVGEQYAWSYEVSGGITSVLGFDVSVLGAGIANKSWYLLSVEKVFDSNYEKHPSTYTLTGRVLEDGSGLYNVAVIIKYGDDNYFVTTDSNGSYILRSLSPGTYTITPFMSDYTFNPSSTSITISGSDVTVADITAIPSTYTLTGRVLEDGSGLYGVAVNIKGGDVNYTVTTDSNGSYILRSLSPGTYTITPFMSDYTFNPSSTSITISGSDVTVADITVAQPDVEPLEITFVSIHAGTFQMGQTNISEPVHTVTLSAFEISETEITQAQYESIVGSNPSKWKSDTLPVESINWYNAITFCNMLSDSEGLERCYDGYAECDFTKDGYRLPTEAEWEYACRAGTTTNYYTGNSSSDLAMAGWYEENSGSQTHPVGQKEPNAWGLYDMHGNVFEWCNDWYSKYTSVNVINPTGVQTGSSKIMRGGDWKMSAYLCLSAIRFVENPLASGESRQGFRVVRGSFTPGANSYTISGTVTGANGVTVTLSGYASESQSVDDGRKYSFTVFEGGNYVVTPSKTGYIFTPSSQTFNNVTSNQTQNFTAELIKLEGKIAFSSYRDGNYEIYLMDTDGSNQTRLTFNSAYDSYPSWSPDGSQITFSSYRDGNYEIYVMNADGSNQTRLTYNSGYDWAPAWSPDGSQIAFSYLDGYNEIYVMTADGSNQTRLTNNSVNDYKPTWSPDGSHIAFQSDRDGNYEIYVMNADGSNQTRLTDNP
ncbi:SUMF1/EgtB/PvdO family nonheme iron enzyme, partial [Candidatus Latescibacterota bacterium]